MKRIITLFLFLSTWIWMLNTCNPGDHSHEELRYITTKTFNDIRSEIDQLEGKLIKTKGIVNYTFYTSLFGGGFYCLIDHSGMELVVTTQDRIGPKIGEEIEVIVVPKVLIQMNNTLGLVNAEYKRLENRP